MFIGNERSEHLTRLTAVNFIGMPGFEPGISRTRNERFTKLSHIPKYLKYHRYFNIKIDKYITSLKGFLFADAYRLNLLSQGNAQNVSFFRFSEIVCFQDEERQI